MTLYILFLSFSKQWEQNVCECPQQQWCVFKHRSQFDVSPSGRRKRGLCQTCHRKSGEETQREARWAGLPHHSYHHQWSPSKQVRHHTKNLGRALAGLNVTYLYIMNNTHYSHTPDFTSRNSSALGAFVMICVVCMAIDISFHTKLLVLKWMLIQGAL